MLEMSDPTILAFDRPLYEEEVAEFDQTELGDENVLWLDISVNDLQRRNILILIR